MFLTQRALQPCIKHRVKEMSWEINFDDIAEKCPNNIKISCPKINIAQMYLMNQSFSSGPRHFIKPIKSPYFTFHDKLHRRQPKLFFVSSTSTTSTLTTATICYMTSNAALTNACSARRKKRSVLVTDDGIR